MTMHYTIQVVCLQKNVFSLLPVLLGYYIARKRNLGSNINTLTVLQHLMHAYQEITL